MSVLLVCVCCFHRRLPLSVVVFCFIRMAVPVSACHCLGLRLSPAEGGCGGLGWTGVAFGRQGTEQLARPLVGLRANVKEYLPPFARFQARPGHARGEDGVAAARVARARLGGQKCRSRPAQATTCLRGRSLLAMDFLVRWTERRHAPRTHVAALGPRRLADLARQCARTCFAKSASSVHPSPEGRLRGWVLRRYGVTVGRHVRALGTCAHHALDQACHRCRCPARVPAQPSHASGRETSMRPLRGRGDPTVACFRRAAVPVGA